MIWSTEAPSEAAREVKRPSMAKTPDDGGHSFIGVPPLGSDWERSLGDWGNRAGHMSAGSSLGRSPAAEYKASVGVFLRFLQAESHAVFALSYRCLELF